MAKNEVVIRFLGDSRNFEGTLKNIEVKTGGFGKRMGAVFAGLQLDRAARQVFQFGQDSIAAFKDAEKASASLDQAFRKFPALADTNRAAIDRLAAAQARKTRFDDDATKSGAAVLAQFGLTGQEILKLTPLLQDYAARTGKDLPAAATDLGKAVMGQGRALKAVGIDFKDTGSAAGNLEQIMGGLQSKVGGFAEREGKTASGRAEILKNQFGELKEEVGKRLLPVLTDLTDRLLGLVDWFSKLSPEMKTALGVVVGLAGAVYLVVKATQAWTAAQAALNVVMSMNPIMLIVIAIAALVLGLVVAYQKVGWFRDAVDGLVGVAKNVGSVLARMFDGMVGAAKAAFNGVARLWNNSVGKIAFTIPSWIPGIGGKGFDMPNIPYLAEGGIVTRPTLAVIGEAGPEAVVPLDRYDSGHMPTRDGAGGMSVRVEIPVYLDGREVARSTVDDIYELLLQKKRSAVTLGLA